MGTKAFEVNHLKVKTDELNKEKNVLSVALKSAKQEKRKERLQRKKERKELAEQCSENNQKIPTKIHFSMMRIIPLKIVRVPRKTLCHLWPIKFHLVI